MLTTVFRFNFIKIKDLQLSEVNAIVDVAGYIKEIYGIQQVNIKNGTQSRDKRNFTIFDDSNAIVDMVKYYQISLN